MTRLDEDINSLLGILKGDMILVDKYYNMIENGEIAWVLIPRIEEYVIPLMKKA